MTSYTMNGHQHPTEQLQPEIPLGIAGNLGAHVPLADAHSLIHQGASICPSDQDKLQLSHDLAE